MGSIYELRLHGRGGQGVVTAAQLITAAAIIKGYFAMTFPEFGPERRGAPVRAYTRIGKTKINNKEPVLRPDVIAVFDPTLLPLAGTFDGLKDGGVVVVNYPKRPDVRLPVRAKLVRVDAVGVAMRSLNRPVISTAMVGALARALEGTISIEDLQKALNLFFKGNLLEANKKAIELAYKEAVAD